MMRRAALGLLLLAGAIGAPRAASACGGCFNPPTAVQVVTDHRMVLSLSRDRTVLWDQFRYSGRPEDFSWILPIRNGPGVDVQEADNLFMATVDNLTAPLVTRPLPPNSFCSSGGGFAFASSDRSAGGLAAPENNGVSVINERVVGPYQVTTLAATDPMALRTWLAANGYAVPPAVAPVIDYYVALNMDFVAVRLRPNTEVSQMKPLRIIMPGYVPTLPLRMIAAGVADKVGLNLMVISDARVEAMNFPNAEVREADLRYDFDAPSDPGADFIAAFNRVNRANGGRAWVTESAFALNRFVVERQMQSCFDASTGSAQPCEADPRVLTPDTRVAFESLGDTAYVTRIRADLASTALDRDLVLASSDRGNRVRNYTYGNIVNTPPDPCANPHSEFEGCSARGGDTTTASALCAALGLIAARSMRRRKRA